MTITALPTPPSRDDPANFASRGDDFLAALPDFATEANALAADVTSKQTAAATSATNAATSATTASTQATNAASSASAAATSASNAAASAAAAAAAEALTGNPVVETITATETDAVTNAVTTVATYGHNSSGTPVAGFGIRHLGKLESSTTADRDAFAWDYTWTTATDASRTSRASLLLVSGGGALTSVIRFDGSGDTTLPVAGAGVVLSGASSGTTKVVAASAASGTLTLPAATDTLMGKATTDTMTGKTFDTAGSGNVLRINGTTISAVSGTGAVALASSPVFTGPTLGVATATSINFGQTALAYYGEGTATLSNGGNTTYTVQQARYTRIGRICILTFYHLINAIGTGSTSILSGLPFTALAQASGGIADSFNSLATNVNTLLLTAGGGGTSLSFNSTPAAGTGVSTNPAIWGNGAGVTGAFTFVI